MNTDKTTKTLLAVIAILLAIIAFGSTAAPNVHAQLPSAAFGNISFSGAGTGFYLFDQNTGSVY